MTRSGPSGPAPPRGPRTGASRPGSGRRPARRLASPAPARPGPPTAARAAGLAQAAATGLDTSTPRSSTYRSRHIGQDRERLVVPGPQPGHVRVAAGPPGPVAEHRGQHRRLELAGTDRVDQLPRVGPGHDHPVLAGHPAVKHPGRPGPAEAEVPVRPDRRPALARRLEAAQRRRRQVHALQPGHPAALGLEAGVQGAEALEGRRVEGPGGGHVEVDVAGRREEVAEGQRPVQVQPDQLAAEGLADPVQQALDGPVDLGPGRRPARAGHRPGGPGDRQGGPPVDRGSGPMVRRKAPMRASAMP